MTILNLEQTLHTLQTSLSNYNVIKEMGIYRGRLIFINIKTDTLYFALDVKSDSSIDLVFRNDKTRIIFSLFFNYAFAHCNPVYTVDSKVNDFFLTLLKIESNENEISEIVKHIINTFLQIQSTENVWLSQSAQELSEIKSSLLNYHKNEIFLDIEKTYRNTLLSISDTLQIIRENEMSIARFGDGEFKCMITTEGHTFQKHDWKLMQELRDISSKQHNNLLVCYPSSLVHSSFWAQFWMENWAKIKNHLNQKQLGDSFISRPEAFLYYGHQIAEQWKEIWSGKTVCFITGEGSRFNNNHYLFDNLKDFHTLYSKSKDAYEDIDNIVEKCKSFSKIDIFIIALGMTGTVLAYRLHNIGLRALDIGHLNNSYDMVFNGGKRPEQLPVSSI